jgi:hypothetical protein
VVLGSESSPEKKENVPNNRTKQLPSNWSRQLASSMDEGREKRSQSQESSRSQQPPTRDNSRQNKSVGAASSQITAGRSANQDRDLAARISSPITGKSAGRSSSQSTGNFAAKISSPSTGTSVVRTGSQNSELSNRAGEAGKRLGSIPRDRTWPAGREAKRVLYDRYQLPLVDRELLVGSGVLVQEYR